MAKLPVVSGKKLCKVLEKYGYLIDHQTGSHIILRNENSPSRRLSILNHQELAKGTLRKLIKDAGLTLEEFKDLI